jgi:hypothetical protein
LGDFDSGIGILTNPGEGNKSSGFSQSFDGMDLLASCITSGGRVTVGFLGGNSMFIAAAFAFSWFDKSSKSASCSL